MFTGRRAAWYDGATKPMKLCDTCGNDISDTAATCRFCGSAQSSFSQSRTRARVQTIRLESGLPTVEEGLARLQRELSSARSDGGRVLRIIHGWGSSGVGGKLCVACRSFLRRELAAKRVKAIVPGEDYSRATAAGRELMSRYHELRANERPDANNPGITFVEL